MNKRKSLMEWIRLTRKAINYLKDPSQGWGMKHATIHHWSGTKTFYSVKEAEAFMKKLKESPHAEVSV